MKSEIKLHPLLKIINGSVASLPSPSTITYWWNFGSLLGLCLIIQVATGVFLAIHYISRAELAFEVIGDFTRRREIGWLFRVLHTNGGRAFFICLYIHIGRGVYFGSYLFTHVWGIGVIILLSTIATAFLGYVLPWGQISFWGAAVITGLVSTIPYFGQDTVILLWGDYGIRGATLTPFFALHFVLPFLIIGISIVHLLFLHETGSTNPLGTNSNFDKLYFHRFFSLKDILGYIVFVVGLLALCLLNPWLLGDPENFNTANPMRAPIHIQPEWYFLYAYAILRSIPNKFGGVVALVASVVILLILSVQPLPKIQNNRFYPVRKGIFWAFINSVILLTWIGARPVEAPYIFIGQVVATLYFRFYLIFPCSKYLWDSITE